MYALVSRWTWPWLQLQRGCWVGIAQVERGGRHRDLDPRECEGAGISGGLPVYVLQSIRIA